MVKGVTQQVVVVRPGDSELFEEAIFLVRPGMEERGNMTERALLEQARKAASEAASGSDWKPRLLFALGGAGATGLCWLLSLLL